MTPQLKNGVLAATIGILGITAIAGWTRTPHAVPASNFNPAAAAPVYGQPAASDASSTFDRTTVGQPGEHNGSPAYTSPYPDSPNTAVNTAQPVSAPGPAPNCVDTAAPVTAAAYAPNGLYAAPAGYAPIVERKRVVYRDQPVVRNRYVERTTYVERRTVHRGRSKKKSALIVAGSAGAGAAIGALAGGGKGAGIGALAGGATGFLYDRLTHNHAN